MSRRAAVPGAASLGWLLLVLVALVTPAAAHAAAIDWADGTTTAANPGAALGSVSYSTWILERQRVTARFLLPIADAQRVAGSDIEVLVQQRIGEYLLDHLAVRSGATPCEAIDQGYDIGRVDPLTVAAGLYGFEIFFQCAPPALTLQDSDLAQPASTTSPAGIVLMDHALFDRLPGQVDFARVQVGNGPFSTQLFTRAQQQLALPAHGAAARAGLRHYLALGITRLLGRWDRLCFLLGAVLLTRRMRDLLPLAAGLTTGYALSLPAALAAGLVPRGALLGSAMGFLIALLAAQLLARGLARARLAVIAASGALLWLAALALLGQATWPVLLLTGAALFGGSLLGARDVLARWQLECALLPALFGFLDGFVLPAALAPQQMTGRALLPMVSGFDVGALLAALGVVALLALARAALTHWPRLQGLTVLRALAAEGAAAVLGGFGVFWMVSRLHG